VEGYAGRGVTRPFDRNRTRDRHPKSESGGVGGRAEGGG
jgi:hypothetical protein